MSFSQVIASLIDLGDQIRDSNDAAARRLSESQARELLNGLHAGEVYKILTLMYLGRGDFGTAGLLNSYEQVSDTFNRPEWAINQLLEKPFGKYLRQAVSHLSDAGIDLNEALESFLNSPIASVDESCEVELSIGPWNCDKCGQLIEQADHGMLQWFCRVDGDRTIGRDLSIVHHALHSPLKSQSGCYADEDEAIRHDGSTLADGHLDQFLGPDGLVQLLAMMEDREFTPAEINGIIMRLFVPGCEQAKPCFTKATSTELVSQELPTGYFYQSQLKAIVANASRLEQ